MHRSGLGGSARRGTPRGRRRRAALVAARVALLSALFCGAAAGDTLWVKGEALEGHVVDLNANGVSFETIYGSGAVLVSFDALEDIRTDEPLTVLYGDDGEVHGRIVGFEAGQILIGDDPATAERIDVATLLRAYSDEEFGSSTYERLKSRLRHWEASLDAGYSIVRSTTDTKSAYTALRLERRKEPTRLLVDGSFRYAEERKAGQPRNVTENAVTGRVRGEYDLRDRVFAFASTRATYDEDLHLSLRLEPRGGLGLRIVKRDDMTWSTDLGVAWVYEEYFGRVEDPAGSGIFQRRGRDDFWTISFGTEFMRKLPYGAIFRASGEYLPAVDAWIDRYLLRGQSSLELPLVEWLSFKLLAIDEYNSKPPEGVVHNSLTLTAGLSLRF